MNITASIQARVSSTRLPNKVLREISGKPILQWQVERLLRSRLIDHIVIATTKNPADDTIEELCRRLDVGCYRGSEDDVLDRIASMVRMNGIDIHVECHGDSPLIDPQIVDEFIGYYLKHRAVCDYVSSTLQTSYPPGLEVTVYSGEVITQTDNLVLKDDPLREHAGYNITRFPDRFRLVSLAAPSWLSGPDTYLEVDTIEDFGVIEEIIQYFVKRGAEHFSLPQVLDFINSHPNIIKRNLSVERRWKELRDSSEI